MFRLLGNLVSPAGDRARLAILIFHRVLAEPDPLLGEVDAITFEQQMSFIKKEFTVLRLGEACARLAQRSLPARSVCINFDDGYADNERVALPILLRLGLPATFFVATGFLGGRTMFNDDVIEIVRTAPDGVHDLSQFGLGSCALGDIASRRAAIDRLLIDIKYRPLPERASVVARLGESMRGRVATNLMMQPSQVRHLHDRGMEIGGHTVNHPILTGLDDESARREIIDCKRVLEAITDASVTLFAYPNGKPGRDYGPSHVRLVRESGYTAAVSTTRGVAGARSDAFQLPRFSPWTNSPRRLAADLLMGCARPVPV
jgi:peptidoglycan/xylan/chitin deacetylase (PgdA/CDA1 family)